MLRIKVNTTLCTGHAMCATRAPEVYQLDDLGYCTADGLEIAQALEAAAYDGARACPEQAIELFEMPDE